MMKPCQQRGFTLLELIVVLLIITIALAITAPRLAGRSQAALLRSAAYHVQSMTVAARARAVLSGAVLELNIVDNGRTLQLTSRTSTGTVTNILPPRKMPNTIRLMFEHQNYRAKSAERIHFQPDGTADGGMLRVVNEQGGELRLQLYQPLGLLRLAEPA